MLKTILPFKSMKMPNNNPITDRLSALGRLGFV